MNHERTQSQPAVTSGHHFEPTSKRGRRACRVLGSTAVTLVSAVAVALPTQTPAAAAPAGSTTTAVTTIAQATTAKTGSSLSAATYESRLRTWINRARDARGIRPLRVRLCHDGFAERWTSYLTQNDQFRHQDLGPYMNRCNLSKAGEILALGSVTPRRMVRMWLNSPAHRQILLDRAFHLSGISAKRDGNGNWVGCVDLGRRMR